jgi:hypothetical protein
MGTASIRASELVVGGQRVELQLTSISACTLRVSLLPIAADGSVQPAANSPELAIAPTSPPIAKIRSLIAPEIVDWGDCRIHVTLEPLAILLTDAAGHPCQHMRIDRFGTFGCGYLFGHGSNGFQDLGGYIPHGNAQCIP